VPGMRQSMRSQTRMRRAMCASRRMRRTTPEPVPSRAPFKDKAIEDQ
jgi:hypothetical protein